MLDKIKGVSEEIEQFQIDTKDSLEKFRLTFVSKKGKVTELFDLLKQVPNEEKRAMGAELNVLKNAAQAKLMHFTEVFEQAASQNASSGKDLTLPGIPDQNGTRHPLSMVREEIIQIFERMGFNLSEGPEIEDDWHNFTALNFPLNHPAREMQDTFFIEKNPDIALRTHTSSVQVRVMENQKPPIRTLSPGRVYRNEAISARAHCVFHQVEGLYIDENVSFADLKQTLYHFVKEMFGKDTKLRFRPSFFPFTEPSAEIDISCLICKGEGCNICKHSGWVEIGGSGMVDPNVLENSKIDSKKYSGYAFGMGIERITMLKYQIKDLRLFTENDVRFLKQFTFLG
ncbi:MAG: phenylalanine--tRNA ligase subunit alpha [Sporocytophaga sp.]|uniref:phenylalanine--tRNA ligase subunit alpha n=1 Tax=Sporocytophaga sp. TaxID=2231183 RepID=UPI001B24CA5D|nr:phenylalanine--tRNA ligase subunit alpha [Sporocytophaga sp.]MBO9700019.1 phenylalanine--tRNA ligase subunit alpha [Sporocytophaga sp.]